MSTDYGVVTTIASFVGVIIGGISFGWNIYNYTQTQKGYIKLDLVCNCVNLSDEKYLVSKTKIENTSKKPISIGYAGLLIDYSELGFDKMFRTILEELKKMDIKLLTKGNANQVYQNIDINAFYNLPRVLEKDGFRLEALPYYYESNEELGSLEILSTSHVYGLKSDGIFSVFFMASGTGWSRGNRFVQDQIIVPSNKPPKN